MQRESAIFRALGDPSRLAIFESIARREAPVKELTAQFRISQPAVSQHLAALRKAGLVTVRRDGRLAYYGLKSSGLKPLADWLSHFQAFWPERIGRLNALLKEVD
ncbi:MAG TPA: metalloregulator ArsR/SmtB family transcription factor [bacterium]|jgi:DNA-binding transcriptional ArsR family regulator|nr:metalloregulator ArsR/SmtB family transcription factor [bacterium]